MNKTRIIALLALAIGIIIHFAFKNSGISSVSGMLIGAGFMLLITHKIREALILTKF